jgi:hypothetical protein
MKDRVLTLILALGALLAFYALVAPKPAAPRERPTRPLSTEAGPNGYLGLQRWFANERIPTVSLRERYGRLTEITSSAPTGNLLLSTLPQVYPMRRSESDSLSQWIASGNTLLVVAGLSDTPDWSVGDAQEATLLKHLTLMTGLKFTAAEDEPPEGASTKDAEGEEDADDAATSDDEANADSQTADAPQPLKEPERYESSPVGQHPLTAGVRSFVAVSEYPSLKWRASSDSSVLLELAQESKSATPALWLRQYGQGQIIVSAFGSLFTNKALGQQDNAQLLANIVTLSLSASGRVIIDDAHQGLVSFYDPEKFFADARLHASLWWLLGLWLLFVIGQQRLRPATSGWNPLDVTSFVQATGGLIARVVRPVAAGEQLFVNFFNEIREQLGLPADGTPVWEWIESHTGVAPRDLARLQELHRRLGLKRRVDLMELHNLLVGVRAQWR